MKRHSALTRLLTLFLVLLTMVSIPITAFAAETALPVPIEDGADPMSGIGLFAYNYNRIPEEMMDNSILRALAYTGYDVAYLKSIKKLYNKSYIASSLKKNAPDVLSGIPYSSDGSGSGLQTVTDKSTATGKAPDIKYFKNQTGLDCADFVTYYLCNYLPNIEGVDTSMFDEMQKKYGYRQDDMRFWMKGCEDLAKQGRCDAYLLDSKDYENNTADYQNAIANCMPGDLIRFGTSSEDWVHYAIYAGSYDGEDYIIHVANSRGPEISLIRYMTDSSSKTSVPLAFYHFYWNDTARFGAIEVNKKDGNGKGLAGAEFTAVHKETGEKYLIGPTNSSGYAKNPQVLYGDYTVTETKFPSGYQSSGTTVWNVTVSDQTPTVTINATNTLITGTIGIKKTDDTGKALSGVQFNVYSNSACTTLVKTITTDSSGNATLSGLTPGTTYYLKEKAAPDGHVYNGTVYSVTVVGNKTTYANNGNPVVNTRMGKLQIQKKDKNGSLGAGYVFGIYSDKACTKVVQTITTDSTGKAVSSLMAPGTYYVRETALPSGDAVHALNTTVVTVTVKAGGTASIEVNNNYLKGNLKVRKSDDAGTPLANVVFGVYFDSKCTKSATDPIRTNAEGVASVQLDVGTYYVRELEAPEGLIIDDSVHSVTVKAGQDNYVNQGNPVVNTRMGRIQIQKKDKNGSLGAGYVFGIYSDKACTKVVQTITTDSTGKAVSSLMTPGTYYVRETALPIGDVVHALNTEVVTVDVQPGASITVDVINAYLQGSIGVRKTDDIGTPLDKVVFGVYLDQDCTTSAAFPIRTNAEGIGTTQLDVGTYYVREIKAPEGYLIDEKIYSVMVTANQITYINSGDPVVNIRMGRLQIQKKDKNGLLGAGYVFGIYSDEACTQQVQSITTDDTGMAVSGLLAPGTYYVRETALPDTDTVHALNKQVVTVTVQPGATITVEVINDYLKGRIRVIKTDDIGTPLANARFGVYLDPDCTISAGLPIRTNSEGIGTAPMDIGTYYVRELEAPEGYLKDERIYPVTVTANQFTYINNGEPVVNIRLGRLRILKQDKYGTLGAGFEFTLYADYKCTEPVSVFATDSSGIAISDWLPEGRYYLRETNLPENSIHTIGTTTYAIDIHTGETYELTYTNALEKGGVGVRKTDDIGTPMAGVMFGVFHDPECTQMAAMPFKTNESGVAVCKLDPGDYYIREMTEKPQYVLDRTVYPVTVTAEMTTYINKGEPVINTRKGKIELIKKDPDGILGAGYVFGIYADEACTELLQTLTTDDTGTVVSDWLIPNDTYYIKESSLPEDDTIHAVSKEVFPVKVLPGETIQVTIINEFLPGQITVLKVSQEGQKLSGAKFLLEWSEDGQNWQTAVYTDSHIVTKGTCASDGLHEGCLTTDDTGTITFTGLHPTLQYRITEVTAPEGYQLLTEPVFTGTLPSVNLELGFTVVNAKPFELPQTGGQSSILMPVSLLLCIGTCMGIFVYLRKKKKEA